METFGCNEAFGLLPASNHHATQATGFTPVVSDLQPSAHSTDPCRPDQRRLVFRLLPDHGACPQAEPDERITALMAQIR
jgi:hypothetical protein